MDGWMRATGGWTRATGGWTRATGGWTRDTGGNGEGNLISVSKQEGMQLQACAVDHQNCTHQFKMGVCKTWTVDWTGPWTGPWTGLD